MKGFEFRCPDKRFSIRHFRGVRWRYPNEDRYHESFFVYFYFNGTPYILWKCGVYYLKGFCGSSACRFYFPRLEYDFTHIGPDSYILGPRGFDVSVIDSGVVSVSSVVKDLDKLWELSRFPEKSPVVPEFAFCVIKVDEPVINQIDGVEKYEQLKLF